MKIALLGHGKMGSLVETLAFEKSHEIVARIDRESTADAYKEIARADMCIDFSLPERVLEHVQLAAKYKVNIVIGTSGWYSQLDIVSSIANTAGIGVVYAHNFSLGVNLYLKLVEELASLANIHEEYDIAGSEVHHKNKGDSPSATAEMIIKTILERVKRKKHVINDTLHRKINPEELHFSTLRLGDAPGTHTVFLDGESDSITISHQARNRKGFAEGALMAAEWILGKKGVHNFRDIVT